MNEKSTIKFVIIGMFVIALLLPGIAFLAERGDAQAAGNFLSQFLENTGQRIEKPLSFVSKVAQSGLEQGTKKLEESRRRIFVFLKEGRTHLHNTFKKLAANSWFSSPANVFNAIGETFNNLSIGFYKGISELFSNDSSEKDVYIKTAKPEAKQTASPIIAVEEKSEEAPSNKDNPVKEEPEETPSVTYVQAPSQQKPEAVVTTVVKEVPSPDAITRNEFESRLSSLTLVLMSKISSSLGGSVQYFSPSLPSAVQLLNKIDNLSGVSITSPSITGGTWADVGITGGTAGFSTLSGSYVTATYASSTALTVSESFYLSSLSDGCLEAAGGLITSTGVACGSGSGSGGSELEFTYGTNIFSQVSAATSSALQITSIGTSTFAGGIEAWKQIASPYFYATSTTATSTFLGAVGIGTSSPTTKLEVTGNIRNVLGLNNLPVFVASTSVGTNPSSISVQGKYAYVANTGSDNRFR